MRSGEGADLEEPMDQLVRLPEEGYIVSRQKEPLCSLRGPASDLEN